MFGILGGSLCCGVWQKKTRTVCLLLGIDGGGGVGWGGIETFQWRLCKDFKSICALFEGQRSSLFILPAQLDQRVCKLSTPAGRLEYTWVDVLRIQTFMHELTDAQTNLSLRCTHASLHTQAGEPMQVGHINKQ